MAEYSCPISVIRDSKEITVDSTELVPGDVVILPDQIQENGLQAPCDMVLISGKCVMNESNLTGETIPVLKMPISKESQIIYDPNQNSSKGNTIFSGSNILQAFIGSKAIVTKIGYQTTKGNMIRDILYQKDASF